MKQIISKSRKYIILIFSGILIVSIIGLLINYILPSIMSSSAFSSFLQAILEILIIAFAIICVIVIEQFLQRCQKQIKQKIGIIYKISKHIGAIVFIGLIIALIGAIIVLILDQTMTIPDFVYQIGYGYLIIWGIFLFIFIFAKEKQKVQKQETQAQSQVSSEISSFINSQRNNSLFNYSKTKGICEFENEWVTVKYNINENNITCINKEHTNQKFTANWSNYKFGRIENFTFEEQVNIIFGIFIRRIGRDFIKGTRFHAIEYIVSKDFNIPDTGGQQVNYYDNSPKIYINTAPLEKIKSLPGINIVMAKRIIKYRDKNGGFKSLDEFYEKFGIKEHFKKQMHNRLILIAKNNDIQKTEEIKKPSNTDRIIDF